MWGWNLADVYVTWILNRDWLFFMNNRDYFVAVFLLLPSAVGHLATIWGHYFRSEREFQHSIAKVTTSDSVKRKIPLWEHHIWFGYTVKYWILVSLVAIASIVWPIQATVPYRGEYGEYGVVGAMGLILGSASGSAMLGCCSLVLFFVLRRSMLHALGFTYAEILPLHRWLGVAIVVWAILHTIGYLMYYIWDGSLSEGFNFDTAIANVMGIFAFGFLLILAILSIPQVRRRFYTVFMSVHRIMTVLFIVCTIFHYPYYILWYYFLPSIILFLVDRFVPKVIQTRTLYPFVSCSLNDDADIIKMTLTSPEPMKPYYPGDYITVQVPEIGTFYHPFTVASYWAEDPKSITLFIRTYNENKRSWTAALGRLCGTEGRRVRIRANVDGVFGDRRHDYLKSEVVVIFAAGVAVTTFMGLIRAVAAHIASSSEPPRIRFHLICTFRTRSELHAYGSFLHQITRDPRFTSWLHVEVYVSRPDKAKTLMGAHAHVIKNDIQVPGQSVKPEKKKKRFQSLRRAGTKIKRALSGRATAGSPTFPDEKAKPMNQSEKEAPISPCVVTFSEGDNHTRGDSADTVALEGEIMKNPTSGKTETTTVDSSNSSGSADLKTKPSTREMTYDSKRLPTFHDAQSTAVATRFAKLDLTASAILFVVPLALWYGLRAVIWEGSVHYCDVMTEMTRIQEKICYGTYAFAPPVGHFILFTAIGYFAMWFSRRTLLRSLKACNPKDIESGKHLENKNLPYPYFDIEDEDLSVEDGNWDEGDVVYSTGRMDVKVVVDRFMDEGVGAVGGDIALVTVFGGGPEGFVDHVERQVKKSKWAVEFHRETWAP
ncbi:hypothetical protein BGZ80_002821 [Entomortierella chlamydospora]|uniref:FAD-binding FR-type domain-containing protein n=1 Tax=Entomortierella chlamydospora TaxID=101097 RepID=A0A9P6SX23_9FUNG|nr:hypothetical protein BGZ80_002821 [Entomortierella chlamydospora]